MEEPVFTVDTVRPLLDGFHLIVETPPRPWIGDDVVGLLVWQSVRAADIDRLPSLRVIVTGSIGFDHIDLEAAGRRGIWVCNVPDYCVDEVADTTMALLLSLIRGVVVLDRSVRSGRWDDHAAGPLPRLLDVRLGLIGFGRIGREVARRARALRIDTRATDPMVPASEMVAEGVKPMALDELLQESTVISLHVPFAKDREHLIGARELALMPPGSYLVNTARGQLVETAALIAALESGRLAGAALDVLPVEPPTASDPIPTHPKLIVTPHAAWYSPKAEEEVVRKACKAMSAVLKGQSADGVIVRGT